MLISKTREYKYRLYRYRKHFKCGTLVRLIKSCTDNCNDELVHCSIEVVGRTAVSNNRVGLSKLRDFVAQKLMGQTILFETSNQAEHSQRD